MIKVNFPLLDYLKNSGNELETAALGRHELAKENIHD
jgi:hypothetical protein